MKAAIEAMRIKEMGSYKVTKSQLAPNNTTELC